MKSSTTAARFVVEWARGAVLAGVWILIGWAASGGLFAQGTINFNNRAPSSGLFAPVYLWGHGGGLPSSDYYCANQFSGICLVLGTNWSVALFGGPPGSTGDQLTLISQTRFRTTTNLAGFWQTPTLIPEVPGAPPGTTGAVFEVRVWYNYGGFLTNYDQGYCNATNWFTTSSGPFAVPVPLGGLIEGTNWAPAGLVGLQPCNITLCPECYPPSSIHLEVSPSSVTVRAGQTVNLLAKFVGPSGYKWDAYFNRWRLNGTNISSAPGTPLVLTNIQHSQAGFYIAEGFQGCGPILSPPVLVTVLPEFVSTEWLAPAQVRMTYDNSPHRAVGLEFTSALGTSNWVSLGIVSNAQVRATFLDGTATNLQRFYRLRLVP